MLRSRRCSDKKKTKKLLSGTLHHNVQPFLDGYTFPRPKIKDHDQAPRRRNTFWHCGTGHAHGSRPALRNRSAISIFCFMRASTFSSSSRTYWSLRCLDRRAASVFWRRFASISLSPIRGLILPVVNSSSSLSSSPSRSSGSASALRFFEVVARRDEDAKAKAGMSFRDVALGPR